MVGWLVRVIAHMESILTTPCLYAVVAIAREWLGNPHSIDHCGQWAAARQVCLDELVVKIAENWCQRFYLRNDPLEEQVKVSDVSK